MSSDEDELDLNEASTPQLNTQTEDDGMDTEGIYIYKHFVV